MPTVLDPGPKVDPLSAKRVKRPQDTAEFSQRNFPKISPLGNPLGVQGSTSHQVYLHHDYVSVTDNFSAFSVNMLQPAVVTTRTS
jgi:hypothetical protein